MQNAPNASNRLNNQQVQAMVTIESDPILKQYLREGLPIQHSKINTVGTTKIEGIVMATGVEIMITGKTHNTVAVRQAKLQTLRNFFLKHPWMNLDPDPCTGAVAYINAYKAIHGGRVIIDPDGEIHPQ